jgi:ATP synthase protein I
MEDSNKKAGWGLTNSFKAFRTAGPLFGSGIQLAAAVAVFFFIGRWLDGKFGTTPWLMLSGAMIGAAGGMYKFIRTALTIDASESSKEDAEKNSNQ